METSIGVNDLALTTLVDKKGTILERIVKSDLKEHIIPSCSLTGDKGEWIVYYSEGEFNISCDSKRRIINYQNNDFEKSEWDVLHLTRQTIDRQLQEKGCVSFHSSSLGYNGRGILFLGGSGSGKSSLILSASNKREFEYISNEITVVNSNQEIVAGTRILVLKKGTLERSFPDFAEKGKKPIPEVRVFYGNDLFQERVANLPLALSLVVNPSLRENTFLYERGKNIMREVLYEDSSTYITGNYLLDGVTKPVAPNLDTSKCKTKRSKAIIGLTNLCKMLFIEGQPDQILEITQGELEK